MMNPLDDLTGLSDPTLSRTGEALCILYVKTVWAAHEVLSYGQSGDIADLVAAERILEEMKTEIAHAQQKIQIEITREDEKITAGAPGITEAPG